MIAMYGRLFTKIPVGVAAWSSYVLVTAVLFAASAPTKFSAPTSVSDFVPVTFFPASPFTIAAVDPV